ncbi:MAG: hypothetical protein U0836_17610 [Pirellulales bacterium]
MGRGRIALWVLAFVLEAIALGVTVALIFVQPPTAAEPSSTEASVPALLNAEQVAQARALEASAPHHDPSVNPASVAEAVPLLMSAVPAAAAKNTLGDIRIADYDGKVAWSADSSPRLIKTNVKLTRLVSADDSEELNLYDLASDPKMEHEPVATINRGKRQSESTFEVPAGKNQYELKSKSAIAGVGDASVGHFTLFGSDPTLTPPRIARRFNARHGDDVSSPVKVFGSPAYLRLEGAGLFGPGQLIGVAFDSTGSPLSPLNVPLDTQRSDDVAGTWSGVPRIPSSPPESATLLVRLESGSQHVYALDEIAYTHVPFTEIVGSPTISGVKGQNPAASAAGDSRPIVGGRVAVNTSTIWVSGSPDLPANAAAVVYRQGDGKVLGRWFNTSLDQAVKWEVKVDGLSDGEQLLDVRFEQDDHDVAKSSAPLRVSVRRGGPRVIKLEPTTFGTRPGASSLTIYFDAEHPLDRIAALNKESFQLLPSKGSGVFGESKSVDREVSFDADENSVTLSLSPLNVDIFKLIVKGSVEDIFGNKLLGDGTTPGSDHTAILDPASPSSGGAPNLPPYPVPGVRPGTGPNVEFPEFTSPREPTNGFNPSDKVETRVARLYYYRDAHRVAQIINRDVQSYNRAAVAVAQQLADKARQEANAATDQRRLDEFKAVEAAKAAREAEKTLNGLEQALGRGLEQQTQLQQRKRDIDSRLGDQALPAADRTQLEGEKKTIVDHLGALDPQLSNIQSALTTAHEAAQKAHSEELKASETTLKSQAVEDRAREEQFRREVAAAREDPDTYAPGKVDSQDPVRQVSISVIGEGLIQLRGPIKGINVIRMMINQIDAPVGQVRISVHTAQINGEHGDRMEVVADRIQKYVDHSRFLTTQSGEMLRKAIVSVAAQQANQCGALPGLTQADRDRKYLYAFFGEDFVRELESLDSEFLHTGNKILSLHSMDSTSLASALFVLALAKNSTRLQIIEEFRTSCRHELPLVEERYLEAGFSGVPHKKLDRMFHKDKFLLLAENAKFESILGFFDVKIADDNTMTPIQREFIRLAQIFKSRLTVEREYKQRVMERALIEERLGNRLVELRRAKEQEELANRRLVDARKAQFASRQAAFAAAEAASAKAVLLARQSEQSTERVTAQVSDLTIGASALVESSTSDARLDVGHVKEIAKRLEGAQGSPQAAASASEELERALQRGRLETLAAAAAPISSQGLQLSADLVPDWVPGAATLQQSAKADKRVRSQRERDAEKKARAIEQVQAAAATTKEAAKSAATLDRLAGQWKRCRQLFESFLASFKGREIDVQALVRDWNVLEVEVRSEWQGSTPAEVENLLRAVRSRLGDLEAQTGALQVAEVEALRSRHPLDHKKFLDMLIDDIEDKYIELLEGTRAHTANVDGYIKRLSTALDDDFNTQFYNPAFRQVRTASRMWDVNLGQVEQTSILANNRAFAKVEPQATMEFDLPKRDILITEGMKGAKALVDDYGALLQDPTFLTAAKLRSGQPTSSPTKGLGGDLPVMRNVLPGLPGDSAEKILNQSDPGNPQLGAALEALIPDPAIYKFETGTGFEIRPVIQPDGQSVVFRFQYMYTTNVREPVRADEKHLGRVKRHFVDDDVQLGNYELREVSRYTVALKASRTSRGVPLLEDVPVAGVLFRPLPSDESSLQQNVILAHATIFPTLFDLMGLRWAPAVADLDPLRTSNEEFLTKNRNRFLMNRVFDHSSSRVDDFLRIPEAERRPDLYRSQETIPAEHPNGYQGPGLNLRDSRLEEGYSPERPTPGYVPSADPEGVPSRSRGFERGADGMPVEIIEDEEQVEVGLEALPAQAARRPAVRRR